MHDARALASNSRNLRSEVTTLAYRSACHVMQNVLRGCSVFVVQGLHQMRAIAAPAARILPMGYITQLKSAVSQIADTAPSEFHCFV
jgi:hypothetical protein